MDVYYVVIECPNTGKASRTGRELGDVKDFRFIGLLPETCPCEHCHEAHTWSQKDAWIQRQDASRVRVRAATPVAKGVAR